MKPRTKILRPVQYRDAYTEAVQPHVQAYFDETVFTPLFTILREARAPMSGVTKAEGPRSRYDNSSLGWEPFPRELPSLGIPRRMMPQVTADQRDDVVAHLAALGVAAETLRLRAGALRPTQDEWSPEKVNAVLDRKGSRRPILISGDNRVVDGHHQWLAEFFAGGDVSAVRFLAPTRTVLDLMATFPGVERDNAKGDSPLERALDSGVVWYAAGVFSGTFSVDVARQLTEAAAVFDERSHVFRLSVEKLDPDVRMAAVASLGRSERAHDRVQAFLAVAMGNFASAPTGINVEAPVAVITADLVEQFNGSVKGLEWITVQPEVDPAMRRALTAELTENLNLDVKRFLSDEIPELRRLVEENVFDGMRGDKLADIIGARFGIAKRKAAFLAFQETSLLVSHYREQQASAIGSLTYVWSTSHDERVRKSHRALNGSTFFWDDPPVTNPQTGAKNNPGEDFGCRCVAMPVITVPGSFEVVNARGPQKFRVATRASSA